MTKNRIKRSPSTQGQHSVASQTTTISQIYQGPIPHPDVLRKFDDLVPGSAAEIMDMAKSEMQHRHSVEKDASNANIAAQKAQLELTKDQSKYV